MPAHHGYCRQITLTFTQFEAPIAPVRGCPLPYRSGVEFLPILVANWDSFLPATQGRLPYACHLYCYLSRATRQTISAGLLVSRMPPLGDDRSCDAGAGRARGLPNTSLQAALPKVRRAGPVAGASTGPISFREIIDCPKSRKACPAVLSAHPSTC